MSTLITALVAGLSALITSVVGFVVAWLNRAKSKAEIATIREALERSGGVYYVTCPHCGTRIYLQGANIQEEKGGTANNG